MEIQAVKPEEQIKALKALLAEAAAELAYLQKTNPQITTSSIASVLERAAVALGEQP